MTSRLPLSALDFAPVRVGETPREALRQTVELARHVEALGFSRFWLAEHHGSAVVASAATSLVIGHVAGKTSTIRVGSGGIMLPNHPPLMIAEQFGTLASLYPGRIDLGLGRASGTPDNMVHALRLRPEARDGFPSDVKELRSFFCEPEPGQQTRAVPGAGLDVPIWLLGSSTFSANQAAALGLPFAFATQIGSNALIPALEAYRSNFEPSASLARPHVMVSAFIIAAETDEVARYLFTSIQQVSFARARGDTPDALPPPVRDLDALASPEVQARVNHALRFAIVGSPKTVRKGIEALITESGADELMALTLIHDEEAQRHSFEIVTEVCDDRRIRS